MRARRAASLRARARPGSRLPGRSQAQQQVGVAALVRDHARELLVGRGPLPGRPQDVSREGQARADRRAQQPVQGRLIGGQAGQVEQDHDEVGQEHREKQVVDREHGVGGEQRDADSDQQHVVAEVGQQDGGHADAGPQHRAGRPLQAALQRGGVVGAKHDEDRERGPVTMREAGRLRDDLGHARDRRQPQGVAPGLRRRTQARAQREQQVASGRPQ